MVSIPRCRDRETAFKIKPTFTRCLFDTVIIGTTRMDRLHTRYKGAQISGTGFVRGLVTPLSGSILPRSRPWLPPRRAPTHIFSSKNTDLSQSHRGATAEMGQTKAFFTMNALTPFATMAVAPVPAILSCMDISRSPQDRRGITFFLFSSFSSAMFVEPNTELCVATH